MTTSLTGTEVRLLPRKQIIYSLGFFVIVGLIAFSNMINSGFLSDDLVVLSRLVEGEFPVRWAPSQGGFFRPLFTLSFFLDYKIWGLSPLGFHLTSILLHSLNAFLVFILTLQLVQALRFQANTQTAVSFGAGILFLLHPSHTEAVSWAAGRADLLATLFCLVSLLCYVSYVRTTRALFLVLSLASFILALLAKESAICFPFLLIVTGLSQGQAQKDRKQFLKVIALFVLILLAFVLVRYFVLGSLVGGYGSGQHLNFSPSWLRDRLIQAEVRSILPALPIQWSGILLKPFRSRIFILFALACAVLITALILLRRKRWTPVERKEQNMFLLVLLSLFIVSLLPVINLRLSMHETQGERFIYLPSVFSCIFVSYLLLILIRNHTVWLVILVCILGFYATRLYQTNEIWREAAELSRSIRDDLVSRSSRDRLVILNAPDNLRGVPVYHNGLPEAVKYFQDQKHFENIELVSLHSLQSPSDEVQLVTSSEVLRLTLVNPNDNFAEIRGSQCTMVLEHSGTSLDLRRVNCAPNADLFFFNQGRMIRMPEE